VLAAIEDIDAILAVDPDRADIRQIPAVRQLSPAFHHAIPIFA